MSSLVALIILFIGHESYNECKLNIDQLKNKIKPAKKIAEICNGRAELAGKSRFLFNETDQQNTIWSTLKQKLKHFQTSNIIKVSEIYKL